MSSSSDPASIPIPWNLELRTNSLDLEHSIHVFWPPALCSCGGGWSVLSLASSCLPTRLPADQRRGYKNVFNALIRIAREEGVPTLWRVSDGSGDLGNLGSGLGYF